jgi:cell division protein FtsL
LLVAKKEFEYQELEYYNEDLYQQRNKKIKKDVKAKQKNRNYKVLYKLFFLGVSLIGLALSLFILYRYANITKMKLEITEMQQQKIQLQKEKEDLMAELEAIKSLTRIEEEALVKLGMDYPTEDQVVYISVDDLPLNDEKVSESIEKYDLLGQLKNIVNLVLGLY